MACSKPMSALYKVKFRVHNYIYEEKLTAELFEDMRVNGLQSQVVHEMRQKEAKSLAVGQFKHPVEIMYIEPCRLNNVEDMEAEVKCFINISVKLIFRKKKKRLFFKFNRIFYLFLIDSNSTWYEHFK